MYKTPETITVCPGCDMILATGPVQIPYGSHLFCPRCRMKVRSPRKATISRTLALSLAGLLLYIPAHFMILMSFDKLGLYETASVFDSYMSLYRQRYGFVSMAVLLTAQVFPLLKLGLPFLVTLGISRRLFISRLPFLLRWYCHLEEWGMTEVYLIGILVTVIKMKPSITIGYGTGFFCFVTLMAIMASISFVFDRQHCWDRIEELRRQRNRMRDLPDGKKPVQVSVQSGDQALASGLLQCHVCHKVMGKVEVQDGHTPHCRRCGAMVHERTLHSTGTTLALVLTACVLLFPANLFPIMEVEQLGIPERSTIMDGIKYFFQTGSYGIGLIILIASILVPIFKIIGLSLLLYSIRFRRSSWLLEKSLLFRSISFVGRWSMLDVFVISLLCTLVKFGFFSTIQVAPAATYFTCVVVTTMFAAISFDQRLLWDVADPREQ